MNMAQTMETTGKPVHKKLAAQIVLNKERRMLSKEELETCTCPICKCYINVAPVRLIDGKITCGRCIGEGINLPAVEVLSRKFLFPCRYNKFGCAKSLDWDETLDHEDSCSFRNIRCMNCRWKGAIYKLRDHFVNRHSEMVILPDLRLKLLLRNSEGFIRKEMNLLYVGGSKIFIVTIKVGARGISHCVRTFCKLSELSNYNYDISFSQCFIDLSWRRQKLLIFDNVMYFNNPTVPMSSLESNFHVEDTVFVHFQIFSTESNVSTEIIDPESTNNSFGDTGDNQLCITPMSQLTL